ncbi:2-(1,2-epoxy-1,2-dihydrophenyl)acetyl-CoA isomerase [Sphingomonas koreensis]|jgi:2-(1,2-epoxy-1,2-dihydrophenyl)acetyl-CoA isomerase|uniref:2-(1,2-epoxy-1,2-dihydrophenyl)acetyl-CoA isomerase n=1 Tax=Sphingomonas koreensis TaxID=93064 RepID=A0A1L6J523_9SPHN|nr:enoyl-CoA hydratase-related protein [Sphingomonas koreensis]APR51052.1 2-(1,2-epoxy-1,2-dihydrophenyl)acetyl-CoA isomerase [Sphingomonas koreensis]MDC7810664.1 enoyl-CoA hydratase-related protein [Sphingomonas koreensis]RSU17193.1 2-(1,2-epoxy-1,2-dihydrophenyl)acetyl-CoA isomerase [Sphingomonas koreensis]RSU19499.1 2-(1,2-epoxy-1,2-dihydrophenyl)acetyl-CoA isomerase [Sphingomonas koreensis]RSU20941.1 2-(1,2-epoxy-1,2-dihydrophenyl)acetyl-CoA isomerase [Sphingomonas koreensis]
MTESPSVIWQIDEGVAIVRLNRPERLNALTLEMLDRLRYTLDQVVAAGARAILVTGEGRAFCSGADLASSEDGLTERDLGDAVRAHYNPLTQTFAALQVPVVTAVNGAAAGAGVSIALSGDIVVAARSSYLLLAFANIGLVPDAGATWLIGKSAGRLKLLEMALLGERLSADAALDAGLVTRVADDDVLLETAMALARKLAAMPTVALGLIRTQAAVALSGTLSDLLEVEAAHQGRAADTSDFREGVAAFLDKRKPSFTGQ